MKNNYDTSSTGVDLELICIVDMDLAQHEFDDLFTESARFEGAYIYGDLKPAFEVLQKDIPALLRYLYRDCYNGNARDFVADWHDAGCGPLRTATSDDIDRFISDCMQLSGLDYLKFITDYAQTNFEHMEICGYSQGEYTQVLVSKKHPVDYDTLQKIIYSAPVYCRLEVNGEEFFLDHDMQDRYDYDETELLAIAERQLRDTNLTLQKRLYILGWLENNLPEYLEYA